MGGKIARKIGTVTAIPLSIDELEEAISRLINNVTNRYAVKLIPTIRFRFYISFEMSELLKNDRTGAG